MAKDPNRLQRVAELIRRELAQMIAREIKDDVARQVSLTDVEVSRDLRSARVYFSLLAGSEKADAAARALNQAAGFLRHELKRRLSLKHIPELRFHFDESLERGARIESLLAQARRESGEDA